MLSVHTINDTGRSGPAACPQQSVDQHVVIPYDMNMHVPYNYTCEFGGVFMLPRREQPGVYRSHTPSSLCQPVTSAHGRMGSSSRRGRGSEGAAMLCFQMMKNDLNHRLDTT